MTKIVRNQSIANAIMRDPATVMDLNRLGSLYPYKLSFMRKLLRRVMHEHWNISTALFNLDKEGYGEVVYEIQTPKNTYHFVVFANYLDPETRTDRVIADKWDITLTLRYGKFNKNELSMLKKNVPLQENGRMSSNSIVLSRANKSSRNFQYILNKLTSGKQPSKEKINEVGYIYRTTAVYGSGKFGMADWEKVRTLYEDFNEPFLAEMFSCFMIRQFSFDQIDHIASFREPEKSVKLKDSIKRNLGIGNATGLGMAPFLIKHPLLINNWIEKREQVLANIIYSTKPNNQKIKSILSLTKRAIKHLQEIVTGNHQQNRINENTSKQLILLIDWISESKKSIKDWETLTNHAFNKYNIEFQEILNTVLIEIHPNEALALETSEYVEEKYELRPEMTIDKLKKIIQEKYKWALDYNFAAKDTDSVFWYRSEEKMEPRLGIRGIDDGDEKEMMLGIAKNVSQCYEAICSLPSNPNIRTVAELVFHEPKFRKIIRRIQTMSDTFYGEIQANLLHKDVLPIHLLRCKLSFFGVGKFDPKSKLWVRNTMFQGAPIKEDIQSNYQDDWFFPVINIHDSSENHEIQ